MVGVVGTIGLLVIVLVNSALAALMTRFFRVRMNTVWGALLYALLLVPFTMVLVLFLLSGIFGLGADLGSRATVIAVTIAVPLALGLTFDYFWMPAPEEIELPDRS